MAQELRGCRRLRHSFPTRADDVPVRAPGRRLQSSARQQRHPLS